MLLQQPNCLLRRCHQRRRGIKFQVGVVFFAHGKSRFGVVENWGRWGWSRFYKRKNGRLLLETSIPPFKCCTLPEPVPDQYLGWLVEWHLDRDGTYQIHESYPPGDTTKVSQGKNNLIDSVALKTTIVSGSEYLPALVKSSWRMRSRLSVSVWSSSGALVNSQ